MANGPTKTCTTCRLTLPVEAFRRNHAGALGRDAKCKPCRSERTLAAPEPPVAPDPSPAKVLHIELRHARERGEAFEYAWPRARLRVLQIDNSWSKALAWSMPEWRACYERRGHPAVDGSALKSDPAA
jgi:hypothetical protein